MGGNGATAAFLEGKLNEYKGDRFNYVGSIREDGGNEISVITHDGKLDQTPVNGFTSSHYFVTSPNDKGVITHFVYLDDNKQIYKSIDFEYNADMTIKPFKPRVKEGKKLKKGEGVHGHLWPGNSEGGAGRKSNAPKGHLEPTHEDWKYINLALKWNKTHDKEGKTI